MAHMLVTGRAQQVVLLANENPMNWLDDQSDGALNPVLSTAANSTVAPGGWYFDNSTKTLTYRVKSGRHFQPDSTGQKRVRLKIVFLRTQDIPGDPKIMHPTDSVALELVEQYKWF
jgi:hypothetical protein